jgi:membrane-associated protease RseP (regulator of RpoE activity)
VLAPRRPTRQIRVGKVGVGSESPVSVQSMTTTLTADVNSTLQQIAELTATGCDIVRVACPSQDDAEALPEIARHSQIPVIADIHFQPRYVFAAIEAGCAAVRVNPGNIKKFDDPTKTVHAGFLGIRPALQRERQGVGYVASTMGEGTWETLKTIGAMPQKVYHVSRAALGLEQRDVNSPMSVVGAGRVAGEFASNDQNSLADRFFSVVLLLAGLNLFLGLVNLVPLPPFDGAGIATTLYEAARRWIARVRGRPDPGAVDAAKLLPVTYVVASLLIVMTVILVYADIVAPVSIS